MCTIGGSGIGPKNVDLADVISMAVDAPGPEAIMALFSVAFSQRAHQVKAMPASHLFQKCEPQEFACDYGQVL